ncbi:MAG: serpin family protein [Clostridiales bacterium]|nr:serpin family protein [Clostridiales bacterium]
MKKGIATILLATMTLTACGMDPDEIPEVCTDDIVTNQETVTETEDAVTEEEEISEEAGSPVKEADIEDEEDAFVNFSMAFLNRVASEGGDSNFMVSPASLMFAMEMVAQGASGQTRSQIQDVLFPGMTDEEATAYASAMLEAMNSASQIELSSANSAWINDAVAGEINADYSASLEDLFSARLECLPFDGEAVALMNEWVNENTKGMIPDIIESLDPDSAMVLINAVAFDATWEDVYEEDQVYEDDFTDAAGILSSVDTLHGTESIYMESETATAFLKPYEGGEYAFVGILPKDEDISANEFASSFNFEEYQSLWESRTDEYIVVTSIPKFDCDYTVSLTGLLGDMGITDVFTSGAADLSGISDSLDLYVSSVIQKTHIAVDEEGTEAAAATSVTLRYNGVISEVMDEIPEIKEVYLTRPFMYMIVDTETGTPVFTGTVNSL